MAGVGVILSRIQPRSIITPMRNVAAAIGAGITPLPRTCDVCGKQYMSAKREGVAHCSANCRAKVYYWANRADVLAKVKARAARSS